MREKDRRRSGHVVVLKHKCIVLGKDAERGSKIVTAYEFKEKAELYLRCAGR